MSSPVVSFQTFGLQGPAGLIDPMLYPKAMQAGTAVGAQQGTMLGNIAAGLGKGVEQGAGIVNTIANAQQTMRETANMPVLTPEEAKRQWENEQKQREAQTQGQEQQNQKRQAGLEAAKILSDLNTRVANGDISGAMNDVLNNPGIASVLNQNPKDGLALAQTLGQFGANPQEVDLFKRRMQEAANYQSTRAGLKATIGPDAKIDAEAEEGAQRFAKYTLSTTPALSELQQKPNFDPKQLTLNPKIEQGKQVGYQYNYAGTPLENVPIVPSADYAQTAKELKQWKWTRSRYGDVTNIPPQNSAAQPQQNVAGQQTLQNGVVPENYQPRVIEQYTTEFKQPLEQRDDFEILASKYGKMDPTVAKYAAPEIKSIADNLDKYSGLIATDKAEGTFEQINNDIQQTVRKISDSIYNGEASVKASNTEKDVQIYNEQLKRDFLAAKSMASSNRDKEIYGGMEFNNTALLEGLYAKSPEDLFYKKSAAALTKSITNTVTALLRGRGEQLKNDQLRANRAATSMKIVGAQ